MFDSLSCQKKNLSYSPLYHYLFIHYIITLSSTLELPHPGRSTGRRGLLRRTVGYEGKPGGNQRLINMYKQDRIL